jgi:hypothetical protein
MDVFGQKGRGDAVGGHGGFLGKSGLMKLAGLNQADLEQAGPIPYKVDQMAQLKKPPHGWPWGGSIERFHGIVSGGNACSMHIANSSGRSMDLGTNTSSPDPSWPST